MATRILLRLGGATNKCFFANVQYHRTNLQICRTFKPLRGIKGLKGVKNETLIVSNEVGMTYRFWKSFGFTVMFSGACLAGATIWEYEKVRARTYNLMHHIQQRHFTRGGLRGQAQQWWRNLTPEERIFVPICFLNVLVYLAWKVPAFQKTMNICFMTSPANRMVALPFVLSTFSHESFLHLFVNMYVLHSICKPAISSLGTEQFVAMYLISGVFGSFFSHLYKVSLKRSQGSLGASASIMGVFGYTCTQFPSLEFCIIFLPMFKFLSGQALKALIAIDLIGVIARFQVIDHVAHLGGVFTGVLWQKWVNSSIWPERKRLLMAWHKFRSN